MWVRVPPVAPVIVVADCQRYRVPQRRCDQGRVCPWIITAACTGDAVVAQSAEQRFRKPQVAGSTPANGSDAGVAQRQRSLQTCSDVHIFAT